MKDLKDIIIEQSSIIPLIEKLKINSESNVHNELDTFDNFAKEYNGEFSKGKIIFKEDTSFYKKVIDILSKKYNGAKLRIIQDRIAGNSMTKEYRYYVSIHEQLTGIDVKCVERDKAKNVAFMAIKNMYSYKEIEILYSINVEEPIEKTFVNIILNNIINGKFD